MDVVLEHSVHAIAAEVLGAISERVGDSKGIAARAKIHVQLDRIGVTDPDGVDVGAGVDVQVIETYGVDEHSVAAATCRDIAVVADIANREVNQIASDVQ